MQAPELRALVESGQCVELRDRTGRLRGYYRPSTNELLFQDRKDAAPAQIDLSRYQRALPVRTDGPRDDDDP
jgi:hypothetical protein